MMEKRIHKRAAAVSGPGMNDGSGGFIDNYYVIILIKDLNGKILGLRFERRQFGGINGYLFRASD